MNKDKLESIFLVFSCTTEFLSLIVAIHSEYSGMMKKTFLFFGWVDLSVKIERNKKMEEINVPFLIITLKLYLH